MLEILTVMPQLKQTKPGKQSVCTVFALVSQRALSIWWKIPLWISRYFRCQMEQHFLLFPEKRFIEIFANFLLELWNFLFDFTFFPEFPIFSIEQSPSGNSTTSGFFGNQEISLPFVPVWKFRNFWLNGERPKVLRLNLTRFLSFYSSFVLLIMVVFHVVFQSTLFTERLVAASDLALVLVMINLNNQFFGS